MHYKATIKPNHSSGVHYVNIEWARSGDVILNIGTYKSVKDAEEVRNATESLLKLAQTIANGE